MNKKLHMKPQIMYLAIGLGKLFLKANLQCKTIHHTSITEIFKVLKQNYNTFLLHMTGPQERDKMQVCPHHFRFYCALVHITNKRAINQITYCIGHGLLGPWPSGTFHDIIHPSVFTFEINL